MLKYTMIACRIISVIFPKIDTQYFEILKTFKVHMK